MKRVRLTIDSFVPAELLEQAKSSNWEQARQAWDAIFDLITDGMEFASAHHDYDAIIDATTLEYYRCDEVDGPIPEREIGPESLIFEM